MKKTIVSFTILAVLGAQAQKTMPLYAGEVPHSKPIQLKDTTATYGTMTFMTRIVKPDLTMFLPEKSMATGMAVIFCPGGGYSGLTIEHEGHDTTKILQKNGKAGFVLKYCMPNRELVDNKKIVPPQKVVMVTGLTIQLLRKIGWKNV